MKQKKTIPFLHCVSALKEKKSLGDLPHFSSPLEKSLNYKMIHLGIIIWIEL